MQVFAFAIDDACAQHKITHRAGVGAARPRQAAGHGAADSGAAGKMRRLERQHLFFFCHYRFDFGQRRAGAHRQHQLLRLVIDDAAVGAQVQRFALNRRAVKGLAATGADRQRHFAGGVLLDALTELADEFLHGNFK